MMWPIYQLLFGKDGGRYWNRSLELTEDQVTISYKTYNSDNESDMQEIIDNQLAPGEISLVIYTCMFSVLGVKVTFT